MKALAAALMSILAVTGAAHASSTILPDSCGKDAVHFNVDTTKNSAPLAAPEAGRAQIVFIESLESSGMYLGGTPSTRFGIDGAWVGANKGNSYFVVSVAPGEHHLCVNWQSHVQGKNPPVGMSSFTAEAGKTYFFEVKITRKFTSGPTVIGGGQPGQPPPTVLGGGRSDQSFAFSAVDDDEGKYRVKLSELSKFTEDH